MATARPLKSPNNRILGNGGEKATFPSCPSVISLGGESVSITPGLLSFRGLLPPLGAAPLMTAIDTNCQIVEDLREKCNINKGSDGHEYTAGVGLTPVVSPTTSRTPISPRVAPTTAVGRPKTFRKKESTSSPKQTQIKSGILASLSG